MLPKGERKREAPDRGIKPQISSQGASQMQFSTEALERAAEILQAQVFSEF